MFEGPKKKAAAQAKSAPQKPTMGIVNRPGAEAAKPAAGSSASTAAAQPIKHERPEEVVTIGAAAVIRGDVTGKGNLVISGRVEGTVDLPDNDANIEKTGRMEGGIQARNVNIRGRVDGDIESRRKVTIFATGTVVGTIISPRIEIEDGAKFKGRIDMGGSAARAAQQKKVPMPAPAPAS